MDRWIHNPIRNRLTSNLCLFTGIKSVSSIKCVIVDSDSASVEKNVFCYTGVRLKSILDVA